MSIEHPHPNPQCSIRIVSEDGREFYIDLVANMAWGHLSLEEAYELFQKFYPNFTKRIYDLFQIKGEQEDGTQKRTTSS